MKLNPYSIAFCVMILCLLVSCSNDAMNTSIPPVEQREGTCFDGVLNGDEVIIDCGGECPGFCPPSSVGILEGELVDRLQLNPTTEYRLSGPLLIREKARLSIPAGTVIKVDPGVGAYIAVAQGGALLISGQPENPVIITSGSDNPAPGDWGGIIICGQAPISNSDVGRSDIIDIFYGGSDVENSSGGINYLRVEYAGSLAGNEVNFDAISFYGVGAFTNITNIQTFESLGNGIRFIGGNANASQLIATNSGANAIVVQDDWSGNGESWYLSGIFESGVKITSTYLEESNSPITTDTISNVSIAGPALEGGLHYADGGGKYVLTNIFTVNLNLGINVAFGMASEQVDLGNLKIDSIQFATPSPGFIPTNYTGLNSGFYTENTATGAGNGPTKPVWANGWTVGLE